VVLIIAAVAIFFRRRIRDYALARADNPTRTRYSGPITVVFGAVLGVLVSLCSVGAGAIGVAVLFFLYPRLPPVRGTVLRPYSRGLLAAREQGDICLSRRGCLGKRLVGSAARLHPCP
jgi:hypothetical protein